MSKLMKGKTVVITGATSGIGYYSALDIANLGAHESSRCWKKY